MSSSTSTLEQYSIVGGLIPAEASARFRRTRGSFPQPKVTGATVDQEGISNNYAISPKVSYADKIQPKTRFLQMVAFAVATWVPVGIAVLVS